MRRAADLVERVSVACGRLSGWLVLAMVLVGAGNAVARWVGRSFGLALASNAWIELQWYLFSVVFLLGGAYALLRGDHVRVDVLYARLGERGRWWIDRAGTLLLLLPFCVFVLVTAWPAVRASWDIGETSPDPGGLVRWPLKALILVGFALLALQGLASLVARRAVADEPERPHT